MSAPLDRSSRSIRLLVPPDYDWIYRALDDELARIAWRGRATTIAPESVVAAVWAESEATAVLADAAGPVALLQLTNVAESDGHAALRVLCACDADPGLMAAAVDQYLARVFRTFSLRKVYFELPSCISGPAHTAIAGRFDEEARLRGQFFYAGERHDLVIGGRFRDDLARDPEPVPC